MSEPQIDEEAIFDVAIQIESLQARLDYLQQVCGDNTALMERVKTLLELREQDESFLEDPPTLLDSVRGAGAVMEKTGDIIGPYKLLQEIGDGGFGVVYMAEQTKPVRRKVALKVIKPGMDTREVIARFEAERQALAMMDHPNIARVFDAGETESGRPYFVMELVKGVPLTEFCNANKMAMNDRLGLFIQVCFAIQHAHQKGVIHRDLKPSNVMVTLHDNKPVPKVIDFGVSKAMSQQLTEKTLFTVYGQMVGTPVYMSPEQAQMSGLDIDTRSDIYSLGVLLYELLTGTTPLDAQKLRNTAYAELQRLISEEESPRPSDRLSTLGEKLSVIAMQRSTDERKLGQVLKGDLDWIVMKALEKERNRRYATAHDFASDLERFLASEPVEACPPSISYKFAKFIKRNRALATTVFVVTTTLLLGVMGTTHGMLKMQRLAKDRDLAADEALVARNEERAMRIQAEENERLLEEQTYFQLINLADREIADGRPRAAHRLLQQADPDERAWEWHYLNRLISSERLQSIHAEIPGTIRRMAWDPTNARAGVALADDGALFALEVKETEIVTRLVRKVDLLELRLVQDLSTDVAVSPSGREVAVATGRSLVVVALESGEILFESTDGTFEDVDFHPDPDRRQLATVGRQWLQVWDWAQGTLVHQLKSKPLHELLADKYTAVRYSPSGNQIAVGEESASSAIVIWDANTGEEIHSWGKHIGPIHSLAFSRDGNLLASGGVDNRIFVWETENWQLRKELVGHVTTVSGLSFAKGRIVSTDDEGSIRIWNTGTGRELLATKPLDSTLYEASFNSEGEMLFSICKANRVIVWDGRPSQIQRVPIFTFQDVARVFDLAFIGQGDQLASGGEAGVRIWDMGSRSEVSLDNPRNITFNIAAHPNGETLASSHWHEGLLVWDRRTGRRRSELDFLAADKFSVAFGPSGRWLAAGGRESVFAWDLTVADPEHSEIKLHTFDKVPWDVCFSPCGRYMAAASLRELGVWNVDELSNDAAPKIWLPSETKLGLHHAFSPDGEYLAYGRGNGLVVLLPTSGQEPSDAWRVSQYPLGAVAYRPDGKYLATTGADETIRIWDLETKELVRAFVEESRVFCLAFSPNGRILASGTHGKKVNLWDTSSLAPAGE